MRTRRRLVATFAVAALVTAVAAVERPAPAQANAPLMGFFSVQSSSGLAQTAIGGDATWAMNQLFLSPPATDPPGTQHTLAYKDYPYNWPRQELIAFDLDWSDHIFNPKPSVNYVPLQVEYAAVTPGGEVTYTFPLAPTSHVIRYWHGLCAVRTPWETIFDEISDSLLEGLQEQALEEWYVSAVVRHYDKMAPMFHGFLDDIRHGFAIEGEYSIYAGALATTFYINPAYTLWISKKTGMVEVDSVHRGVIGIADVKEPVDAALKNDLPAALEESIASQMRVSLDTGIFDSKCDPDENLEDQQDTCFAKFADGGGGDSVMQVIFETALLDAGYSDEWAKQAAMQMNRALRKKNFSCQRSGSTGDCHFNPIIQRLNVLPNYLEMVFAPEFDGTPETPEHDLQLLYQYLPLVQELADPDANAPDLCWNQWWQTGSETTYVIHGAKE